jgi:hypothetical protein
MRVECEGRELWMRVEVERRGRMTRRGGNGGSVYESG